GAILHTSDGGTTWAAQTSGVTTNLYDVLAISSLECWAVGAGGTMLHTLDGENWTNQGINTMEDIYSISFGNAQSGLACGSNGLIAMMADCSLERIGCGYGSVSRPVESGVKYHIRISSAGNKTGLINGTLVFIPCILPANDDCTDAQEIASVPFHASVDLTGATKWSEEPRGCFTDSIATVWYKYTAQQSGSLSIQATKGAGYGEIEVFTGACGSLQLNQTCQYGPIIYPVQAGQTYYIRVGAEANALGVYDVSVSLGPTDCLDTSTKSVWPDGTIVPGDTLSYEVSVRNKCDAPLSNVTVSDAIPANTTYVPGSTRLNGSLVADSSPGIPPFAAGMLVNSAGLSPGAVEGKQTAEVTFQSRVNWDAPNAAVITNTAQIMANEAALISTSVSNTVSVPPVGPPDNDECTNATDVTLLFPYYDEVDIAGATIAPDEPVGWYWGTPPFHTIWYKCVPAKTGWLSFGAWSDVSWLETDVFKGSCGNLVYRGGSYSGQVLLSEGESYLIRVGSWDQAGGTAHVSMDFTPDSGMSVSKAVWPPGNAPWGRELTYSIHAYNECDVPATGCRVTDVIPVGLTYVPNSTTLNEAPIPDVGGQPPFAGDMDISSSGQGEGVIASCEEAVVGFRATITSGTTHGSQIENSATVQINTPSPGSTTATATVTAMDLTHILANDECSMAKVISGLPYEDSEDISWATIATDEPEAEWWGLPWCTVWYRFVPTEDTDMVVRAVGEGFSPVITIFSGSCSSPTYVSTNVSGGGGCTPGGSCFDEYYACARVTAGQTYLIRVGSQSETAGPQTVSVAKAPDLVMNAVSGPAQASPGQRISVSRSVANIGGGPAIGEWYDGFYLSSDDQLDEGDYYLGYVERVRELNPGEGYDGPGDNLMIPANTPPGLYWILGDTD
ncbi:MAG: hypothetical protein NTU88_12670, partial [Armatimonadetes bacterium]|nr:hypothetical protein [Armatimonadota bacterium]